HSNVVASAQFSPDGKRIVTGSWDNSARVWDAQTGLALTEPMQQNHGLTEEQMEQQKEKEEKTKGKTTGNVYSVNHVGFVKGVDGTMVIVHYINEVKAQFSRDGQRIVTASTDGTARVWDAHSGQPLTDPMEHGSGVTSAQFSRDAKRIVTVSLDKTA